MSCIFCLQSTYLFQPSGSPPIPILLHAVWKTLDSSWRDQHLWTWMIWKNNAQQVVDLEFQKLHSRGMTEHWKFQEHISMRGKLSAVTFQRPRLCHIWGLEACEESSWKDLGELDAQGTTQQTFNQQFLTAKLSPLVMIQGKDEPASDHGDF